MTATYPMTEPLAAAVREAKIAAGLDPDGMYTPGLWVGKLPLEQQREFWHWQTDRVVDRLMSDVRGCPCGAGSPQSHVHGEDNPVTPEQFAEHARLSARATEEKN